MQARCPDRGDRLRQAAERLKLPRRSVRLAPMGGSTERDSAGVP